MTEKEFMKKYDEIINWSIEETDKITNKLIKENKIIGLDTNKKEYEPIHKERDKSLKKLIKEYKASADK